MNLENQGLSGSTGIRLLNKRILEVITELLKRTHYREAHIKMTDKFSKRFKTKAKKLIFLIFTFLCVLALYYFYLYVCLS